jgi:hypothetical protein
MTDTTPWCIVIESSDGTVGVRGPFLDEDSAIKRARQLAEAISAITVEIGDDSSIREPEGHDTFTITVGDPDNDPAWLYLQRMSR